MFGNRTSFLDVQSVCLPLLQLLRLVHISATCNHAGAYVGLLQQLRTILEPSDTLQPTPAAPAPQPQDLKPKDIWLEPKSASLRWQHSCFQDLMGDWRSYSKLRPGKYADRVRFQAGNAESK